MTSERKEISRDIQKLERLYDSRRSIKKYIMGNKDLNTAVNNNYRNSQSETHKQILSITIDDNIIRFSFNASSNITNNQNTKYRHFVTRTIYLTILQFSWAEQ